MFSRSVDLIVRRIVLADKRSQVYDNTSLLHQSQSSDLGLADVRNRARTLLARHASETDDRDVELFLEHHVRVAPRRMAAQILHDEVLEDDLERVYGQEIDSTIPWARESNLEQVQLPAWYRCATAEVLFEAEGLYADTDRPGLGKMIRGVYDACPIDLRTAMRDILVVGQGHALPGLAKRLAAELPGSRVVVHGLGDDLAWVGASLAAALKIRGATLTADDWQSSSPP